MATAGGRPLLLDANVLIDLCDADRTLLRLVSAHVGAVHAPLPILMEEVATLDEADWNGLGLRPVEPTLTLASTAAARRAGLSFNDHLCLLLAREHGWTCVTNDRRLRRECEREQVPVLWGLELLALLVERRVLTAEAAAEAATAIHHANPGHITVAILRRFRARIHEATTTGGTPQRVGPEPKERAGSQYRELPARGRRRSR